MTPTFFDIETTAIDDWNTLAGLTKIHCLAIEHNGNVHRHHGEESIKDGLEYLMMQDLIVGHNAMNFDIPAIQHLFPAWRPQGMVRDTKVLSRLAFPDQRNQDFAIFKDPNKKRNIGSYSLKAWGERLGVLKGDYNQSDNAWDEYSDEMMEYCVQDVMVTKALYHFCMNVLKECEDAIAIEHQFHAILRQQELRGFGFSTNNAVQLYCDLKSEQEQLRNELISLVPPQAVEGKSPAYWYVGDDPNTCDHKFRTKKEALERGWSSSEVKRGPNRVTMSPFNPDSRAQIARYLKTTGWTPTEFTPNGQPKIDETTLADVPGVGQKFSHYLMLSKRIGFLSEGDSALLRYERRGRIHGVVHHIGTATSRCSHTSPNIAQVPSLRSPYGKEFRRLFIPSPGMLLCGIDAAGLELRCLAHYLHRWDNGAYVDLILNGDIHEANREAAGIESRDQAKMFIYARIYGAREKLIAGIIKGSVKDARNVMAQFDDRMPALSKLNKAIKQTLQHRKYLVGLDGRRVPVRSQHSALNFLLQSAGAIIMKQATVDAHCLLRWAKIQAHQVAHVHDEMQFEVPFEQAEECGEVVVKAIRNAATPLAFLCPLDAKYSVGRNWAETH